MRFIFIVGRGRSGTHFLRNILNRHPNIWITGEINFFSKPLHKGFIKTSKHLYPFDTEKKIDQLFSLNERNKIFGYYWKNKRIDFKKIKNRFLLTNRGYNDLYRIILEEEAILKNKNIGGEKTPHNIFFIKTILKWFPNSKFINIIRDPRAIFVSEISRNKKRGFLYKIKPLYKFITFLYVSFEWYQIFKLHKLYTEKYPNNYIMIKFEDLILNHISSVKILCDFLDIDYTPSMLFPKRSHSSFDLEYDVIDGWKEKIPLIYDKLFYFFFKNTLLNI